MGKDTAGVFFVVADEMESTGTLTIEAHDFGKGLGDDHLEALVEEETEAVTIFVKVTGCESLVSGVEEGEQFVFLAHLGNHGPLLLGGVNSGRVVGTSVQQDNGTSLSLREILEHSIDIETLGLGIEIAVRVGGQTAGFEDSLVVSPSRLAHVDGDLAELVDEFADNLEGTSS